MNSMIPDTKENDPTTRDVFTDVGNRSFNAAGPQ
jgi:hypothetical protein